MKPVAELQKVSKFYGSGNSIVTALREIDLTLYSGQLTLIEGPSGCGKTTLLEVLGLLLPPNQGNVLIEGEVVSGLGQRKTTKLRRKHVAFVFQDFNLLESLGAHDNIAIVAGLHGSDAHQRTREALETVGLSNRGKHLPSELSGGEKQRVAIGRALVSNASLLLADEPTANLDWSIGQSIVETLAGIAHKRDRSVVVVSHDPRLEAFADRVVSLSDGVIVKQRRAGKAFGAIVVMIAMLSAAIMVYVAMFNGGQLGSAQVPPPPAQTRPSEYVDGVVASAPAVTEPFSKTIQISCDRPGIITDIKVESGQHVAKGDALVLLDDAEAQSQLKLSQAQLASANAALADLKSWNRPEEIEQARAVIDADTARVAFEESQFKRLSNLQSTGAAGGDEVDRAKQNRDIAKAQLREAQAILAKELNGPTASAVAQAEARVAEASASVAVAQAALERRCLRSPVDGNVLYVYMRPGEAIDLQSPLPILSLGESGKMRLRADVDESDIGRIVVGQKILANSDSLDKTYPGTVISMEPIMGRRNILTNRPRERQDTRIREVIIQLQDDTPELPIDLMMTVRFLRDGLKK